LMGLGPNASNGEILATSNKSVIRGSTIIAMWLKITTDVL